ncbi:uncharacterized mitochondrial protein AtMg00310-like [Vicia villosa]|uniref:uncharacterized mitochondrial protein AtMg00310-like n=1 Tax=Vicia villosa TaxID=3911 RepID=UPI00273C2350|nr:uncharacterized mitochondrial protein AtMg00310-like [Vicia villosa]
MSFSRNVHEDGRDRIHSRVGVKTVLTHSKYLGLPVVFGKSKKEVFGTVINRVWKKIKGWKEKFLSRAGKEVLIKSVAQAIPSYIMSCYKLPESICQEIEAMVAKFWWGSKEGERKVHWLSWNKMARAKGVGGMGFQGISEFNTSLLGKQYWRMLTKEDSLLGHIFKSRYYPRVSIEDSSTGFNLSYAWRSILSARDLVQKGSGWRIRTGEKVTVGKDRWIPNGVGCKVGVLLNDQGVGMKVSEMINHDGG